MRTAQRETAEGTRTIAGQINASGTLTAGTGFTCVKAATGAYTVRWTFPVRAILGSSVSFVSGGYGYIAINGHPGSVDGLYVQIYSNALAAMDNPFEFTAIVIPR
jgi:hypothetical protein